MPALAMLLCTWPDMAIHEPLRFVHRLPLEWRPCFHLGAQNNNQFTVGKLALRSQRGTNQVPLKEEEQNPYGDLNFKSWSNGVLGHEWWPYDKIRR